MRYLNFIEMLNYALKILRHDSRQAVPVSKVGELLGCMKSIKALSIEEQITDIRVTTTIDDMMGALLVIKKQSEGMLNMTDVMKQSLVGGVVQIKEVIATIAYKYYENNDFELTESLIPTMRDIVETYVEAGGKI